MELDQPEQERRRDVVRQIADDAEAPRRLRAPADVSGRPLRLRARSARERHRPQDVARHDSDVGRRASARSATRSRSISTARIGAPVAASGSVSAPVRAQFQEHVARRRPNRGHDLRRPRRREEVLAEPLSGPMAATVVGSASRVVRLVIVVRIAPPVSLLDVLDLLFGQPEVVPDLVDERLADRDDHVVFVVARCLRSVPGTA